jgi:hypothetical protein
VRTSADCRQLDGGNTNIFAHSRAKMQIVPVSGTK